jgi:DNA transposition AAA+ family ATPase
MLNDILKDIDFAADWLPPGQEPIITSRVKRFKVFCHLIADLDQDYPTIGLVTGAAGLGKTIAIRAFLGGLAPRPHTSLPSVIKLEVKPRSTPKALALDIVSALRDKPRGRNIYQVSDEAVEAIVRNDLKCLFLDEGNRLDEDSFDVVRYIFDKSGCPIVVVGLPSIESVIDRYDKFKSRVGLRMEFLPLERSEIQEVVLPNLVFPCWQFDPDNEEDRILGELICDRVNGSFRKLRNLLQAASKIARYFDEPRITPDMIEDAFKWAASIEDRQRQSKKAKKPKTDEHERRAEARQEANRRKRAKSQK